MVPMAGLMGALIVHDGDVADAGKIHQILCRAEAFDLVEGDVELFFLAVGVGCHPLDIGQGEIAGLGPGGKFLETAVDGIGAMIEGGKKGLKTAGWGQELGLSGIC